MPSTVADLVKNLEKRDADVRQEAEQGLLVDKILRSGSHSQALGLNISHKASMPSFSSNSASSVGAFGRRETQIFQSPAMHQITSPSEKHRLEKSTLDPRKLANVQLSRIHLVHPEHAAYVEGPISKKPCPHHRHAASKSFENITYSDSNERPCSASSAANSTQLSSTDTNSRGRQPNRNAIFAPANARGQRISSTYRTPDTNGTGTNEHNAQPELVLRSTASNENVGVESGSLIAEIPSHSTEPAHPLEPETNPGLFNNRSHWKDHQAMAETAIEAPSSKILMRRCSELAFNQSSAEISLYDGRSESELSNVGSSQYKDHAIASLPSNNSSEADIGARPSVSQPIFQLPFRPKFPDDAKSQQTLENLWLGEPNSLIGSFLRSTDIINPDSGPVNEFEASETSTEVRRPESLLPKQTRSSCEPFRTSPVTKNLEPSRCPDSQLVNFSLQAIPSSQLDHQIRNEGDKALSSDEQTADSRNHERREISKRHKTKFDFYTDRSYKPAQLKKGQIQSCFITGTGEEENGLQECSSQSYLASHEPQVPKSGCDLSVHRTRDVTTTDLSDRGLQEESGIAEADCKMEEVLVDEHDNVIDEAQAAIDYLVIEYKDSLLEITQKLTKEISRLAEDMNLEGIQNMDACTSDEGLSTEEIMPKLKEQSALLTQLISCIEDSSRDWTQNAHKDSPPVVSQKADMQQRLRAKLLASPQLKIPKPLQGQRACSFSDLASFSGFRARPRKRSYKHEFEGLSIDSVEILPLGSLNSKSFVFPLCHVTVTPYRSRHGLTLKSSESSAPHSDRSSLLDRYFLRESSV